uniref:Uncharacterized protein n=1 Tax=Glossina austeni TaxID=7395 RepID=A0A1A9VTT6_GLOAU
MMDFLLCLSALSYYLPPVVSMHTHYDLKICLGVELFHVCEHYTLRLQLKTSKQQQSIGGKEGNLIRHDVIKTQFILTYTLGYWLLKLYAMITGQYWSSDNPLQ